ncbi:MAG: hypothetical protein JXR39_08460 [Marinilabiliaceae bacterium]|nr:hypothetical protein [Marinilabiliaceae bacterium]
MFQYIIKSGMLCALAACLLTACEPQEKDEFELGALPNAQQLSFTMTPLAASANVIEFTSTTPFNGVVVWDLGNNAKAKGNTAVGEYPFAGTYAVTYAIFTEGGSATITQNLVIANDDLSLLNHPLYTVLTGGAEAVNGKTWVFDQYHSGHFGVGPAASLKPEWWAAGPNAKLDCSLYTNEFTFKQVGVELTWVNNGSVYTNGAGKAGLEALGFGPSVEPPAGDFDVAYQPKALYHFSLSTSDSTLVLSDGAFFGHYAGTSTYKILSITKDEMYIKCMSTVESGNGWWYRLIPKELNVKPVVPTKAVPLLEGFETEKPKVVFATEDMGDLTSAAYQNPAPVPVNESAAVFLYHKKAGVPYSNISHVVSGYKFDLTKQNQITMKVFIPSYNDYVSENAVAGDWVSNKVLQKSVAVKLQNNELGTSAYTTQVEVMKTDLPTDQWVELTFDFSAAANRTDLDKILIQFGTEGHNGGGIFFFDDFKFAE